MTSAIRLPAAVLLPGTGSDEVFVRSVFGGPLAALGVPMITPAPSPGAGLAEGFLAELDRLADRYGTLLVGGISFGAHLAAEWAVANPGRCGGLLAALPAWNGESAQAPAAVAATVTADLVASSGVEGALAQAAGGSPGWLAEELGRAWRRHGAGLEAGLRVAAGRAAPTVEALRGVGVPAGVGGCVDDPVHPVSVAREWARALPRGVCGETSLEAVGQDRETLGRVTVLAFLRALGGFGSSPGGDIAPGRA
ncbi:alpha/beta hydrolase [Amycolatopsis echigonensis]|uniref:Alpha/beta hydrolase n=2 Tax=Amycolatopsis echigonensis TaxID=2576905 RepID=A0A8E2AZF0_9PSEU|nr:alpha/beta hydrolase [Amycolatopsis echigonensis]MBB2498165.1 alpha/beta hydrolase [Amycolatopsis echigonensis]